MATLYRSKPIGRWPVAALHDFDFIDGATLSITVIGGSLQAELSPDQARELATALTQWAAGYDKPGKAAA